MNASVLKFLNRAATRMGFDRKTVSEYIALQRSQLRLDVKLDGKAGRVGLIGCGRQGRVIAGAVKKTMPDWQVTHAVDVKLEAAAALREGMWPEVQPHDNLDAFLSHAGELDVVVIATTATTHFALTKAAIERGAKAILVEKPVTDRLADADALVALADQHGCRVAVNHTRRYLHSVPGLERLLASGVVGAPRAVYFMNGRAGFANIGTHLFDLARALFHSEIVAVRADLDSEIDPDQRGAEFHDSTGRCEARFANGVRLVMDLSGDMAQRQQCFTIVCEQGRIEVDEKLGTLRLVGNGMRVWESSYVMKGQLEVGIGRALEELVKGKAPRCTLADGRAALEAAIACHASNRANGAWVELPLPAALREETFRFA